MTQSPGSDLGTEWDERYSAWAADIPDVRPSAVLIDVAGRLGPGRALDIGCGIGAEAVWLAENGWEVVGLDVSQVALDRAEARARDAGVEVSWVCAPLEDLELPDIGFDLVSAHYPALLHAPDDRAAQALLAAVSPGGTLLVVHHADVDVEKAKSYGFDPADYLSHEDVVAMLGADWDVEVARRRLRDVPAGIEGQHTHDDVIVARRR